MKTEITFKTWICVFFGGIRQFICNIFSWKNKTPFWRVIWATITVCVVAFTAMLGYAFYDEFCRNKIRQNYYAECYDSNLSGNYKFRNNGRDEGKSFIYDAKTRDKVLKGIDWIAVPEDGDSLIIVAKDGKRGFVNRFTAEIAIPFKYDAAWSFTDGVAAVCEGDSVYFIDHSGKPVSGKKFVFHPKTRSYVYHGDYCAIATGNGKMGLIDKSGNWAVEPTYDWICSEANNCWKARKGDCETGLWYALNDKAELVTETGYPQMEITEDLGIVVTLPNHLQVAYDFNGVKSDQFLCRDLEKMYYDKDEWDEEGNKIIGATTLMRYRMSDGYEGLCTVDGDIITEPIYWEVMPITKDTYLCKYKDASAGVIVNSKGEIVQHQNL